MRDYIEQAKRTESLDLFKVDNPRLLHAVIGINTEVMELTLSEDETNMVEEIGDTLWYLAILVDELGISFEDLALLGRAEDVDLEDIGVLIEHIACLLDTMKRSLFYGVPLDEVKLSRSAGVILMILNTGLEAEGFTLEDAQRANIAKLSTRYPDKFTSAAAVERDVIAEIKELKRQIH